ncbi:MAG TPA: acyl-CoA dehydrogenase family protein [Desulfomonilia bacterium]|nr:acyl-CoA dehydrogenase family protein [Desulfomonilia bacterium]
MLTAFRKDLVPFEELARSFAAKELVKKVEEHDRYPFGKFFDNVLERAHEVGFLGIMLAEDQGGISGGIGALCVILDAVCRVDSSLGGIIFANALSQEIMRAAGAHQAAKKIFSKATSARGFLVACPAYIDPAQVSSLPKETKSGKDYILTGSLELLVLGSLASWAVIPARLGATGPYSLFLVDLGSKGIEKSEPVFTLGLHACPAVDITLAKVKSQLLGEVGRGREYFSSASMAMHIAAAAMNAGIMKGSLDEALAYAKERQQGGCEIINWSEVSMILANMGIKTHVADLCVSQACHAYETDSKQWGRHGLAASLHVHEIACDVVTDGIQVLGGNGYMKDYGQEKRYRDARQVQALLGTAPMKKIGLIRELAGLEEACSYAL